MSAQRCEQLIIERQEFALSTEPLEPYLDTLDPRPELGSGGYCTALYRGYIGVWEIRTSMLWLKTLGETIDNRPMEAGRLFPGRNYPIHATWFTGQLRLPVGPILIQSHIGSASESQKNRLITIRDGGVIRDRTYDHLWRIKRKIAQNPFLAAYLDASVKGDEEAFFRRLGRPAPLYWFTREGMELLI